MCFHLHEILGNTNLDMWQKANQWLLRDCKVEQCILQKWRWNKDVVAWCLSKRVRSQQNCTTMYAEDVLCAKGIGFHMERIYRKESRAPETDLSNGWARTHSKVASTHLMTCAIPPILTPHTMLLPTRGTGLHNLRWCPAPAPCSMVTWRQWWPIGGKPTAFV